ncbi:DUF4402 domain-containing protein [Salegentibacter mishustinae]|uniref:DUF4402 domain-containing protein n=1 Tax=Salegentibacter mishustinae TaxID=270918 RepID=A0A0Q9ZDF0_9FLAO|nr:DUF4402 domain-containing protein [Salegentibacter mishustinae]KRG27182.1 hypothetical protein APR42_11790 [Salegentibacter mishustinae]PNW21416.1 hypothetical protein APB85_09200 [Salegentibacter mishustinae]PZX62636.1 uncharacterized protein DUF4402 [Salegentibacter mishustinae]GGW97217.1 hypothetical protein GCM10008086_27770 [Salegentibacter mishustinae]
MKKITFILLALISGTAFAQEKATGTAQASADIVSPITIEGQEDLNFGKVANNTAGTVVVATDGSASGLSQIGTTTPKAATFDVTAANGYAYSVTLPTTVTLKSGDDEISVDSFTDNAGANPTGSGGIQTIGVGATLTVANGQATGNYTGEFQVTVSYE